MGDPPPLPAHLGELARHIVEKVTELQEPLGFQGWSIITETGELDSTAACAAEPEYKRMRLSFDLNKLETGDEVDEIIVHEMMHAHTWAIWDTAEVLMNLVADAAPKHLQEPLRKAWGEQIRLAGEDVATQVGFTTIRLLRRLWAAEEALANARTELKSLRKQAKALDKVANLG